MYVCVGPSIPLPTKKQNPKKKGCVYFKLLGGENYLTPFKE